MAHNLRLVIFYFHASYLLKITEFEFVTEFPQPFSDFRTYVKLFEKIFFKVQILDFRRLSLSS